MKAISFKSFILIVFCSSPIYAQDGRSVEKSIATPTKQQLLEQAFSKKMSGATLVGSFTIDGREGKPPAPERYELGVVKKANGDFWTFNAKIKYGNVDQKVAIPITVKMLWAGDTPVISITDFKIPGMGTFTARVLFYGDKYVGTWKHGKTEGHMFGKIVPKKKSE